MPLPLELTIVEVWVDDVFLSAESITQVIPLGEKVVASGALPSVPGALFAKNFVIFSLAWRPLAPDRVR
jgi:hypothetical protein